MIRSATALAALLILPGIALAQEEPDEREQTGEEEEHTVVRGESLWVLADYYYGNPFRWPRIFEANDAEIDDPHWIYPGQRFRIPGIEGAVTAVEVEGERLDPAGGEEAAGGGAEGRSRGGLYPGPEDRTVFYRPPREDTPTPDERTAFYGPLQRQARAEEGLAVEAAERYRPLAVSEGDFYAAPWLLDEEEPEAEFPGRVADWAGTEGMVGRRETVNQYDRLLIPWGESPPPPGTDLQLVRVERSGADRPMARPTGLARVVERSGESVVAVVVDVFHRPRIGDRVLPAPDFPLERGQDAERSDDGLAATVGDVAAERPIQQVGDIVFLDVGRSEGVAVGDVFELRSDREEETAARARVVRVFEDEAVARISRVTVPVLQRGAEVHRTRRMP